MNTPKSSPEQAPGHYGAGYGEQVPADAPPQAGPATDCETEADAATAAPAVAVDAGTIPVEDDGAPVVFTPEDVGLRPPDHPPTESAPASEKAGLIFERS
jgi:hypothetical protein